MRKITTLLSVSVMSLFLLGNSKPFNDGIQLSYFPQESLLKTTLNLENDQFLNTIIYLPEVEFDQLEAREMIERIDQLPHSLLAKIHAQQIRLQLFVGKLTDYPSTSHLSGTIPKGYESKKTWDDVPGIGGGKTVLAKIGHSEKGAGHGSINLELHELAHSIDQRIFKNIHTQAAFLKIWEKERAALFPQRTYFLTYPEEYFAECFAMFYVDAEHRALLQKRASETFEVIKNLK